MLWKLLEVSKVANVGLDADTACGLEQHSATDIEAEVICGRLGLEQIAKFSHAEGDETAADRQIRLRAAQSWSEIGDEVDHEGPRVVVADVVEPGDVVAIAKVDFDAHLVLEGDGTAIRHGRFRVGRRQVIGVSTERADAAEN